MIEKPFPGRARIEHDGFSMKITIPSKKNWFIILFLSAWMGGWYFGESSAIKDVLNTENIFADGFMLFWLAGWTIGGLFAIIAPLWTLFGCEYITIEKPVFKIEKGLMNYGIIKKSYDLSMIKNLELSPESDTNSIFGSKKNINEFWGLTGGKLRFDYGMKTIKFGIGIDEAEARHLIEELISKGYYRE